MSSFRLDITQEFETIERRIAGLLAGIFDAYGFFREQRFTLEELKARVLFKPAYDHWLAESLAALHQRGLLGWDGGWDGGRDGGQYTVPDTDRPPLHQLWDQWRHARAQAGRDNQARWQLAESCLQALPDLLASRQLATDVIFPDASMALVENLYQGNAVADLFNGLMADALVQILGARLTTDGTQTVRILEIGAGTGGTTVEVLKKLQPFKHGIAEYLYTDISQFFLLHAREQYAPGHPYLRTALFDVESPPGSQGIEPGRYDFVIATNILHATKNIRHTLRHVKTAMRRNGTLLINEVSDKTLWGHVTFGLLEGWWRHEDTALRIPGSPLLAPKTWRRVLADEGFDPVVFPGQWAHGLGQQVILAASDGWVRQSISETANHQPPVPINSNGRGGGAEVSLRSQTVAYFKQLMAATLKLRVDEIAATEPLESYGIDSILINRVNAKLRANFGDVRSTLLFEAQTIDALADHFIHHERPALERVLRANNNSPSQAVMPVVPARPGADTKTPASAERHRPQSDGQSDGLDLATEIAIIGISGRYSQADNLDTFWKNLEAGHHCVTEIPADRWSLEGFFEADVEKAVKQTKSYSKWGSFLPGFADFDPLFFGIPPSEAMKMDPQERLFLQATWEALEDAGHTRTMLADQYGGRVGVFVGISRTGFELFGADFQARGGRFQPRTSFSSAANRVSYFLNIHGPSMPIDTMCSSSLTAIHEACEHLRRGTCDLVIAGGVNLFLHPSSYVELCASGMLSQDGKCKSFGAGGDGFVPGEGVGAVVLKPLQRAIADGDNIHAVIRGSSVNHGGKTNGYTVPNPLAQRDLIQAALAQAGVHARSMSYIEAHGTGTELGDPIEITGLSLAFEADTDDTGFCAIGSVKSNLGHLEAAAGIAGLTKVVLQLKHGRLTPSLHATALNPNISFEKTPFYVQHQAGPWPRPELALQGESHQYPRLAGVSSFGAGGTNAHVVLEEYQDVRQTAGLADPEQPAVIVLSAKTEAGLRRSARQLLAHLEKMPEIDAQWLHDAAFSLQVGREAMAERLGCVVSSGNELIDQLRRFVRNGSDEHTLHRGQMGGRRDALALFRGDDDLRDAVAAWIQHRKYDKLLSLWVWGGEFDWHRLHAPGTRRRVSLPTYPFECDRYWFDRDITSPSPTPPTSSLMMVPQWQPRPLMANQNQGQWTQHYILLCDLGECSPDAWAGFQSRGIICHPIDSQAEQIHGRFVDYAAQLLDLLRTLLRDQSQVATLIQLVVPTGGEAQLHSGLSGMLKTAYQENPNLHGQVIEVDPSEGMAAIAARLMADSHSPGDTHIRHGHGERLVQTWQELTLADAVTPPWRDNGVYLISGGAGGLGLLFAREIATQAQDVTLILTGRSELSDSQRESLRQLEADLAVRGARLDYCQTDVSDRAAVDRLAHHIQTQFDQLDGILHAAGLVRDSFILKKNPADLRDVLAPKVSGTVNLAAAFAPLAPELFILFSSVSGVMGNPGQADYAAANGFMNAWAEHCRQRLTGRSQRTVALCWPLWQQGGMGLDVAAESALEQNTGMKAMPVAAGMDACYRALAANQAQVMIAYGDAARLRRTFLRDEPLAEGESRRSRPPHLARHARERLWQQTLGQLVQLFGEVIQLHPDRIDVQASMEDFGVDSIIVTQMNQELAPVFQKFPKTLFFEYPTLASLCSYFVDTFPAACASWTGLSLSSSLSSQPMATGLAGRPDPSPAQDSNDSNNSRTPEAREQQASRGSGRTSPTTQEPIAIIGVSARFPQAETLDAFWSMLRSGTHLVTEIPSQRWPLAGFYEPDSKQAVAQGKSYGKWGAFLEGFADFDPLFFNLSPQEALRMDPQERLFLQTSWSALEDAGYTPARLAQCCDSNVGVFAGITKTGYDLYGPELWQTGDTLQPRTSFASVANRVSFLLNLKGPSMPVDTMCSSSLTAIHEACQRLRLGDCALALAGGVNLYLHPANYVELSTLQMLSKDGRCRSFGNGGDGFVPGEGVAVVLLKPLANALADGDQIHAVIRGSQVNHGGRTNGYTVPNPKAQADLIRRTLDKAGVDARTVSYVEAHGTGTSLGDPIEVEGLTQAFRADTSATGFCALGSVKSNLGHLEAAAGMAGLVKIVLQMRYRQLVPSLHAAQLNPHIEFDETPFQLQQTLADWPRPTVSVNGTTQEVPRIACLSSFGAGGSNAHVVVEEYPGELAATEAPSPVRATPGSVGPVGIVLSAKNQERLQVYAQRLKDFLVAHRSALDGRLQDIAHTLQLGRVAMDERLAMSVSTLDELLENLDGFLQGRNRGANCFQGCRGRDRTPLSLISNDEDFGETVDRWIQRGKLSKLLELWTQGLSIDWTRLYQATPPGIVSLPTYPFARERYWLPELKRSQPAVHDIGIHDIGIHNTAIHNTAFEADAQAVTEWTLHPVWDGVCPKAVERFPDGNAAIAIIGGTPEQLRAIHKNYPAAQPLQLPNTADLKQWSAVLDRLPELDHILWIAPETEPLSLVDDRVIEAQDIGVIQVFRLVKALLSLGYGQKTLGWTVITDQAQAVLQTEPIHPIHAGIHGFVGSMAKEFPQWQVRLLDLDAQPWPDALWTIPPNPQGEALAYRGNQWFQQALIPVQDLAVNPEPFRTQGTYIIIGGAGGLGEVLSRHLIQHWQAQVIWVGRRPLNLDIQTKIDALAALGAAPWYLSADAANVSDLERVRNAVQQKCGSIHGVVHSALGSYDQSLTAMDEAQFRSVLSAKVDITVRVAQVFAEEPLDFILFFSSLASFGKVRGMSSYVAGCVFQDAFALRLSQICSIPVKVINWGFWSIGGGARISDTLRRHLQETEGVQPINADVGMGVLAQCISSNISPLAFIKSDASRPPRGVVLNQTMTQAPRVVPSCLPTLADFSPAIAVPAVHPLLAELDGWMVKLLLAQFLHMGVLQNGVIENSATLRQRTGVLAKYQIWWDEVMAAFGQRGWIHLNNGTITVEDAALLENPELIWRQWQAFCQQTDQDDEMRPLTAIIDECFRALPAIVRGHTLITDILFPAGAVNKMEVLYKDNSIAHFFNTALAEVAAAWLQQRLDVDPQAQIRILEIGAGTGGTTSTVLPHLAPFKQAIATYCYTDISNSFLMDAAQRYGSAHPYLEYRICDIEQPLAAQGLEVGTYDLVIATNVLHATHSMGNTVGNAKAALAKNGVLLLNEMTDKTVFATLIFGLIDGWSLAQDTHLRIPGSPGLTPNTWRQLLAETGFNHIQLPVPLAQPLAQQIIVAESDGVIRQRRSQVTSEPIASPGVERGQPPESHTVPTVDKSAYVQQQIVACLSRTLRLDDRRFELDVSFSDYGVDSILGAQFITLVSAALDIDLNTTIIFNYPTVERLSAHVVEAYGDRITPPVPDRAPELETQETLRGQETLGIQTAPASSPGQVPRSRPQPPPTVSQPPRTSPAATDIAVIGLSLQVPGAQTPPDFWQHLLSGQNAVSELPTHYLDRETYYSPQRQKGKTYCHQGGVLEDRDCFDPLFFNLSPRDAESMNPHQRLIMQEGWKALEDAGYNPKSLAGVQTGIFVGSEPNGYFHETFTGASEAIIASRLSYFLNLRGPALVVNTGCSSAATALHLACESLRTGECSLALAGGVYALMNHAHLISLSEIEMLSPSGCCRTFDAEGDGMVLSEGVGMVTLKRLADAERDGDPIYGVIAASGLNQDGASNGITAPSGVAQEELIADVYQRYGINPEDISYVEAHGTGTRLGDPVEANALTRAFRRFTKRQHYCALGSAKAHIGHTAAGAGIIGLIKVLLSLQHRKLPGLPHFETLNPRIEFDHAPFFIPAQATDWARDDGKPLMAALSSFGHSGTNVHFVIREYQPPLSAPTDESAQTPSPPSIVPLSAKDEQRLRQVVQQLRDYLRDNLQAVGPGTLRNLAYTLQTGREAMNCRTAFVANGLAELQQALTDWLVDGASGRPDGNLGAAIPPDQLSQWLAEEQFEAIADHWSQGGSVDWQRLYGDRKPVRIHLPTYPFAKERYWANGATQTGLGAAPVSAATVPTPLNGAAPSDYLLASPTWQAAPVASSGSMPEGMQRLIMLWAEPTNAIERVCERLAASNASVIRLDRHSAPLDTSLDAAYTEFSVQVLQHVRNRLRSHARTKTLVQVVIPDDAAASVLLGIAGLLQTAQQENPNLEAQVIALDVSDTEQGLLTKIAANARCSQDILIRYAHGVRQVIRWHELSPGDPSVLPWKERGIYLITGGAGGIGLIFASEIASRVNQATLVLIGRSPLTPEKAARLNAIAQTGTRIDYRQVDISQPQPVQALILDIQANYGPLNGVIHAAGIHRDNYLIHKPDDEFRAVLAPKVQGTVNLDQSLAATPLDFFALFSSGAAVTGNLGQADYAAANGFMDQFATHRQRLVAAGQRFGQTLSINWPLWQQGGMQVDAATVALMHQRTGMQAMQTAIGIQAFYQALMAKHPQVGVVAGDLATIRQRLFGAPNKTETVCQTGPVDQQALRAATLQQLKQLLGARLKLSPERMASQEPFERYGIDSILITDLNQDLAAVFGEISKTLFFEYQTLSALTDYFVADHPEDCQRWCDLGVKPSISRPTPVAAVPTALAAGAIRATGDPRQEPIAIIGISGHYPQADSLAAFWSNLSVGKDGVTEIPPERWSLEGFYLEQPEEAVAQAMSYGKWGSFLDGFAEFDPQFFNISGREAMSMDPQERLFLQSAWAALEDAGYTRETLQSRFDGNVGVFAGITKTGYDLHGAEWRQHGKLFYPHTSFGSVANRVSYLLNLHGPSMPIDTMCSSSLFAIHEACERLRQGVCPMAIAGGVNLYLHPTNYVELSALKMLSKGGKCRSFGEGGDGFVPGEGVGVVILKPLAQALQDRDRIHGVIRATAVNHGGKTNGYTVPNPKAQAEVIRRTLDLAGIHARTVSYVEAHGTGTALGDPIEVTGLTQAFHHDTTDKGFCALGSVKSNIGHLEAAAGMAGLTKILLQMKHGKLAPSLHADRLNPNISFENTPFQVQRSLADWHRPRVNVDGTPREYPRIAGLSSFGAGGANAHVILEEYMDETIHHPKADADNPPGIFVLSAKNEDRLRDYAMAMRHHLQTHVSANQLPDFLYTLQVGREAMDQRLAMVVHSQSELVANLSLFMDGQPLGKDCFQGRMDHEQEISTGVENSVNPDNLDPTRLAQAWVQGQPVNWHQLHQLYRSTPPRCLAAPTYPFARERYWIAPGELSGDGDRPVLTHAVARPTLTEFSPPPLQKIQRALTQAPDNQMNFVSPAAKPKDLLLRNLSVPVALDPQDVATSPLSDGPGQQISEGTLIRSLKRSLAKALFIDEGAIAINQPYIDMGLDSIVGVEWVHAINKEFGLSLSATRVYDFPTLRQLATYLRQTLADTTQVAEPATPRVANSDGSTPNSEVPISNGSAPTSTPTSTVQEPAHGFTAAQLETFLVTSLAKALFIEPKAIDTKKPFVDFGLDSIVGVEWVHAINTEFGVNLSATRVYDYPTIQALAQHLKKILPAPPTVSPPAPASLSSPASPAFLSPPSPPAQPLETSGASRDRQPSSTTLATDTIAVVGMSGRYPQARDLEQFWQNLAVGQNSIREVPRDRWNVDAYFDPNPSTPGKIYCKWLGALDEVDCFDPLFFGISPAEAEGMDPQHRLFLEEGYRAFEDAGYGPRLLSNVNCGVYMGVMSYEYAFLLQQRQAELTNTGNSFAIGAARIPYFLNLKGPAIPVDTACSSSLVAIHLACQALRQREIDMALAGGVSLYLIPESYVGMCAAGMVSPDGQCKAFDDDANGFVPGEGAGSVVLKRLADAERDGDHIYGLIIASGINQDGKTNGITAPSAQRQIDLLQSIYTTYGIEPSTISYVETHGTGTRLGDPIELEALTTAFRQSTDGQQFCALGSVKSNIGHTSAAAGVAGVQKTLLAMQHQQLPASLHFKKPNRHFKFAESPFYVNTELKAWTTEPSSPRRAAVSAFGFSGTNAHLVLEDYVGPPSASPAPSGSSPVAIVLSARRVDQLQTVVRQLHDHLIATETPAAIELPSLAYTLQVGRAELEERLAFIVDSMAELVQLLQGFLADAPGNARYFRGQVNPHDETVQALVDDEAFIETVDKWMQQGNLDSVLQLWVKGLDVDWHRLYGSARPRRISLPTYPFARHRCWVDAVAENPGGTSTLPQSSATQRPLLSPLQLPTLSLQDLDPLGVARDFVPAALEDLLAQLLWGILHAMGLFQRGSFDLSAAMAAGKIRQGYERWLQAALQDFVRRGQLDYSAGKFVTPDAHPPSLASLWTLWDLQQQIESRDPLKQAQFPLIEACLRSLPEILQGDRTAVEVMFPDASLELVEPFYQGNPVSDLFNEILSRTLTSCIEQRIAADPEARIRILEIGAGTGGMTAAVLPCLKAFGQHVVEYCHTDISKSFQFHAEEQFVPDYPFVRAQLFDVERPPTEQGVAEGQYDFVIASNVLHATRNIRRTVGHARSVLRSNGLLLVNEISRKSLLGHLTFGLLDGWWLNEDNELRIPGSPALYPETWEKVLREEGFAAVVFPCGESHELGQQILVASLGTPQNISGEKEFLACQEDWCAAPLEVADWTPRIDAVTEHEVLVISAKVEDADAITNVCETVARLAEYPANTWTVRHLSLDTHGLDETLLAAIVRGDVTQPLTIFLCVPPIVDDGIDQLAQVFATVQSVMRVMHARSTRFYCCYTEPAAGPWLYGEALAGLFKSAMAESVNHRYRVVSHDAASAIDGRTALSIVQEWLCDETQELPVAMVPMVRYEQGQRYELRAAESMPPTDLSDLNVFRQGATYLMVGALGPAGLQVCEELGRRYQARLVLLSRRGEHQAEAALNRIRAAGATVLYRSVDIVDETALMQAMASVKAEGVTLNGVIHMARRVADAPIVQKNFHDFIDVMAAKVMGGLNLDAVTADEPLDFFLMYSSMAAFGIQGSPDYAFSAAYQNTLARFRDQQVSQGRRSGRTRSICWGQWDVDGVVSAEQLPKRLERLRGMGMDAIDVTSAMALMQVAVRYDTSVVGFMAVFDRERVRRTLGLDADVDSHVSEEAIANGIKAYEHQQWTDLDLARFLDSVPDQALTDSIQAEIIRVIRAADAFSRPAERSAEKRRNSNGARIDTGQQPSNSPIQVAISPKPVSKDSDPLRAAILASIKKTLKIPESELDWNHPLQDYGLDSIIAMQLATTLEKHLNCPVQPRWLIEYPTLNLLMEKLNKEVKDNPSN